MVDLGGGRRQRWRRGAAAASKHERDREMGRGKAARHGIESRQGMAAAVRQSGTDRRRVEATTDERRVKMSQGAACPDGHPISSMTTPVTNDKHPPKTFAFTANAPLLMQTEQFQPAILWKLAENSSL